MAKKDNYTEQEIRALITEGRPDEAFSFLAEKAPSKSGTSELILLIARWRRAKQNNISGRYSPQEQELERIRIQDSLLTALNNGDLADLFVKLEHPGSKQNQSKEQRLPKEEPKRKVLWWRPFRKGGILIFLMAGLAIIIGFSQELLDRDRKSPPRHSLADGMATSSGGNETTISDSLQVTEPNFYENSGTVKSPEKEEGESIRKQLFASDLVLNDAWKNRPSQVDVAVVWMDENDTSMPMVQSSATIIKAQGGYPVASPFSPQFFLMDFPDKIIQNGIASLSELKLETYYDLLFIGITQTTIHHNKDLGGVYTAKSSAEIHMFDFRNSQSIYSKIISGRGLDADSNASKEAALHNIFDDLSNESLPIKI